MMFQDVALGGSFPFFHLVITMATVCMPAVGLRPGHFPSLVSFHPHAHPGRLGGSQTCPFRGQAAVQVWEAALTHQP